MLETGSLVWKYHRKSIICSVNSLGHPFIFDSENMHRSQVWSQGFPVLLAEGRRRFTVLYGCPMLIELTVRRLIARVYRNCRTRAKIWGTL